MSLDVSNLCRTINLRDGCGGRCRPPSIGRAAGQPDTRWTGRSVPHDDRRRESDDHLKRATSGKADLEHEDVSLPDGSQPIDDVADAIIDGVRRKAGRPSLTGKPAASPRVSFRVTPEVRDRAAAVAGAEAKTISELAREALEARVQAY